ncbi:MAG: restriction endonuclease subunit [Patescibacteria group bacterium]|nr:restriction endonuclease subunit [Patescibacteria group bacterium]
MKTNWQTKKLGEVCEIVNGSTPLRSNKDFWEGGNIDWFTIEDIRKQGRVIRITEQKITQRALKKMGDRLLPPESVLLCCTASVGEYAITKVPLVTNQQFNGLVIKDSRILNPMFLFYFSSMLKDHLLTLSGKATIDFIPISRLKNIDINYPQISEQKRIVKILDETFKKIERIKKNLEANRSSSIEFFDSYLQDVLKMNAKKWKSSILKELSIKIGSGATPRGGKDSYTNEGTSLVRSMNVHDRFFKEKNLAYINEKQAKDLSNVTLEENDVLVNITGASVARSCVFPGKYLPARVNQHVSIIRVDQDVIDPKFLNFLLTSNFYKKQLLATGEQGSTRQAITKSQLECFEVEYPSLVEQKSIVKKLDALSEKTKKLEEIYKRKLQNIDELKKSILQKAFNGKL